MLLKKLFLYIIIFYNLSNIELLAKSSDRSANLECYKINENRNNSKLEIEKLTIEISNNRSWVRNLFNIHYHLEKKKQEQEHEGWVSDFRINEKYKKRFDGNIFVKYKGINECKYKAKIRVTGDLWWHLDWKKGSPLSSLQVKLIDGHIYNATQFKLFLKKARNDHNEIFVANFFKQLGFISPKTFFINAKINNIEHQYIFQEDIRKELLEDSFFREGPILEGDERFTVNLTEKEKIKLPNINYAKILNQNFVTKNLSNSVVGLESLSNLNKLFLYNHIYKQENKIIDPFSDVFYLFSNKFFSPKNAEILNSFEALSYAIDTHHGLSMDDRRFYYDTFKKYYLPIYYDGKSKILDKEQFFKINENITNNYFSNEAILGAGDAIKMIESMDLKIFLAQLNNSGVDISYQNLEKKIKKIIYRLNIINNLKINDLKEIQNEIILNKIDKKINNIEFVLTNYKESTIFICNFELKNCKTLNLNKIQYFKILNEIIHQEFMTLKKFTGSDNNMIFLFDNFKNTFNSFDYSDDSWNEINNFEKTIIKYKNADINIDENNKVIQINQLSKDGKVIFIGGVLDKWDINYNGYSKIIKKDILNNYDNTNNFTGCLNFYEVEFKFTSLISINGLCEDTVNIIRSNGQINKILIYDSLSDALDIDFSELKINRIDIKTANNDCVDLSSGKYNLGKLNLINCGDKGLSVGEKSLIEMLEIQVDKANIGLASKDSSSVIFNRGVFNNTKICLAAYNKKQEYSGGYIKFDNMNCDNYFKQADIDIYSKIFFKEKPLTDIEYGKLIKMQLNKENKSEL